MLSLPPSVRVYVAPIPVDARKGFDGLSLYVRACSSIHSAVICLSFSIVAGSSTDSVLGSRRLRPVCVWNADDSAFLSSGQSRVRAEKLKPQSWRFVWRELTCRLLRAVRAGNGL